MFCNTTRLTISWVCLLTLLLSGCSCERTSPLKKVKLPSSELSHTEENQDSETEASHEVTIDVRETGLQFNGTEYPHDQADALFKDCIASLPEGVRPSDCRLILKAENDLQTSLVQVLIERCQTNGFVRFKLESSEDK